MKDYLVKQGIEQFVTLLKSILSKLLKYVDYFINIHFCLNFSKYVIHYSIHSKVDHLKILNNTLITTIELAELLEKQNGSQQYEEIVSEVKSMKLKMNKIKIDFDKVVDPVRQLYEKTVTEECLGREWKNNTRNIRCPCKTLANARVKSLVERLRESWNHLLRDRATRSLTYNDEQFHALEKIKVCNILIYL